MAENAILVSFSVWNMINISVLISSGAIHGQHQSDTWDSDQNGEKANLSLNSILSGTVIFLLWSVIVQLSSWTRLLVTGVAVCNPVP